jgi:hypothetical protein
MTRVLDLRSECAKQAELLASLQAERDTAPNPITNPDENDNVKPPPAAIAKPLPAVGGGSQPLHSPAQRLASPPVAAPNGATLKAAAMARVQALSPSASLGVQQADHDKVSALPALSLVPCHDTEDSLAHA